MRVTSNIMFTASVQALQNQQQDLMRVQEQSSTGLQINRPSDDPSGTFRQLLFSSNLSEVQSLKKTSNLATQRLTMGDVKIGSIHDRMLQAQDLVMKYAHSSAGGDPTLLKLFSKDSKALYDDVLAMVNADLEGVPIFGGGRTNIPFETDHLDATQVRVQKGGQGPITEVSAWYANNASIVNENFIPPSDQEEGTETSFEITVSAGQYDLTINGVKQPVPVPVTEESGKTPFLALGNGVRFTLGGTAREGDVFHFNVVPDGEGFKTTKVQRQGSAGATSVRVSSDFVAPPGPEISAKTSYKLFVSQGKHEVEINGVKQESLLSITEGDGKPSFLDLGNGVTFNIGDRLQEGDIFSFDVEPIGDGFGFKSTPVQLQRRGGMEEPESFYAGFTANVSENNTLSDFPLSVKISYLAANQTYEVDVNGIKQPIQRPTTGQPPVLDLGNGMTFNLIGQPQVGDVFYFEVVPAYKGGAEDRAIQVANGNTLPGNVTGAELLEGTGPLGRGINILGALAALRGAFLRVDAAEVALQLDRIREGGAQSSDFQAITGVRGVQVEATNAILTADELILQEAKANNSEVDLFEVMSRLQQISQAMQMMATAERQVLDTSLIDFIR